MKITITIHDEDALVFRSETLSIDSAIQDLGRFERELKLAEQEKMQEMRLDNYGTKG